MVNKENKILAVDKPVGFSTYDMIRLYKKKSGFIGKIGHGGTLDPFAQGLVLLLLGQATKRFDEIRKWRKTYLAGIRLGISSDTQDIEGKIRIEKKSIKPKIDEIKQVLEMFQGKIEQKVPIYSAVKQNGEPLYKLARQGREIVEKSKKVTIHNIELVSYQYPLLIIRTQVSSGTYIRQLGSDIAEKLGTAGLLYFLQREKVGKYTLKDCLQIKDL